MAKLKKFLNPGLLREFLKRALAAMDRDASLFVLFRGTMEACIGPHCEGLRPDHPDVMRLPLAFDQDQEGFVGMYRPGLGGAPEEERQAATRYLDMLVFCLQGFAELESARRLVAAEALSKYRELALIHRSTLAFNNSLRPRDIAAALLAECRQSSIPARSGAVFLRQPGEAEHRIIDSFGADLPPELPRLAESRLFTEVIRTGRGEIVNDLTQDLRWDGDVPGMGALLVCPAVSPNRCVGAVVLMSDGPSFDAGHLKHLSTLASVAGISMDNALNFEGIQVLMDALLTALAQAIDARDRFTSGHSARVARLAAALSRAVNQDQDHFPDLVFREDDVREIYYAGLLHDVGKIGVREEVLTKSTRLPEGVMSIIGMRLALSGEMGNPDWERDLARLQAINRSARLEPEDAAFVAGLSTRFCRAGLASLPLLGRDEAEVLLIPSGNLTPEEREEIQRHPAESFRILQHIPFPRHYRRLLTIIRQHHERMDGSGYPRGEKGADILLQSRILAIVDIYDAITQERHYKAACPRDEALDALRAEAKAGRIDPRLVDIFCRRIDEIEAAAADLDLPQIRPFAAKERG